MSMNPGSTVAPDEVDDFVAAARRREASLDGADAPAVHHHGDALPRRVADGVDEPPGVDQRRGRSDSRRQERGQRRETECVSHEDLGDGLLVFGQRDGFDCEQLDVEDERRVRRDHAVAGAAGP